MPIWTAVLWLAVALAAQPIVSLRTACDKADARACAELSRRYRAGDGVPRDLGLAVAAAQEGCEAGEPALCVEAGRAVLRGEGVKRDPEQAKQLFSAACTSRTQAACLDLALMYETGDGIAQDAHAAMPLFDKACRSGDSAACELLGDARWQGIGTARDPAGAQASYRRACDLEVGSSCTKLADSLRVLHDDARADAQYRKACAADEKDACIAEALPKGCSGRDACLDFADLCADYLAGYDALAEPSLARAPCEAACTGGVGEACDSLADMYQEGLGVGRDDGRARDFRKRACELGDRDACEAHE
jgi:TPR repeat protein